MVFILPLARISPEPVEPCNDVFFRLFNKVIDSGGVAKMKVQIGIYFQKYNPLHIVED